MITKFMTLVFTAVVLVFAGAVMTMSTTQPPAKAIPGPIAFTTSQNTTVQNSTANSSAASSIVTQPQPQTK